MVSTILPAPAGVDTASTTRTPGPSRKMCFLSSAPLIARGKGSASSNDLSPDTLSPLAISSNTRDATTVSVGDRSRVIGATAMPGSPPKSALTTSATASGSIVITSASGDEADAATVMACPSPSGLASTMRDSSTLASSIVRSRARFCFRPSLIAGADLSTSARAASVTRSGSPVSPTSRSMM